VSGRLAGKRTAITGGASGIGLATALRFAAEGARVGIIDIDGPGVDAAASRIEAAGGEALRLVADVTQESSVAAAFEAATEAWGALDVVVVNAGIEMLGSDTRVHELDAKVWDRIISVNLTGQFHASKHGIRAIRKAGGGSLICTASPCAVAGLCAPETAYSASKAGVMGLIRVMAADYAPEGIRVNGVIPGFIDTPMNAPVMVDKTQLAQWEDAIPIKRIGRADEVANMMLFLASDESSYAIGGIFTVDGGQTAI
jgi:NAD(P)-dependent dehydrogenase (short-subunit alcohol dehydrogenase family)